MKEQELPQKNYYMLGGTIVGLIIIFAATRKFFAV
jgi:hypothetical protein